MDNFFHHRRLDNGVNLYIYPTKKYKTTSICVFLHTNLSSGTATKTALLPQVLKRGTQSFTSSRKLNLYLEDLYGAKLGADVLKRGEVQTIQLFLSLVDTEYTSDNSILDDTIFALKELLLNPLVENGGFKPSYLDQEKEVLKRNIEALYSNKMAYSLERCIQEMCKDEPFSIYRYGRIEDLPLLDEKNLYRYYIEKLRTAPVDIFVLGNVNGDEIYEKISQNFNYSRTPSGKVDPGFLKKCVQEVKFVEDKQDINQGKLNLGFRTNTKFGGEDYYALLVCNGILGGGPHSKLFQNVREKEGLAYYAFSRLEKAKGLMIVSAGIDFIKRKRTVEIIKAQVENIKRGKISHREIDSTIKSLVASLKEAEDSPAMMLNLFLDGVLNDVTITPAEIIDKVKAITIDDVVKVSEQICLDTVHFLNKR